MTRKPEPTSPAALAVPLFAPGALTAWAVCFVLGAIVGLVGTIAHRSVPPWGVVAALVTLLAVCTVARAAAGAGSLLAAGAGWMVAVQLLSAGGPGGDVLVPAATIGYVWVYGGLAAVLAPLLAPRTWFAEVPWRVRDAQQDA